MDSSILNKFIGYPLRIKYQFIYSFWSDGILPEQTPLPQAAWNFIPNSLCQLVMSWLRLAFPMSTFADGLLGTSDISEAW